MARRYVDKDGGVRRLVELSSWGANRIRDLVRLNNEELISLGFEMGHKISTSGDLERGGYEYQNGN